MAPLPLLSGSSKLILPPVPSASSTPRQAADLPQATSTNGTGTHTVLLKHNTAQVATTKEVPVAREARSPDGSPKMKDTFVRPGHAAGTFISRTLSSFAAGWRPSSSSPSPCPPSPPAPLSVQHSYQCTPRSCRLTHFTHHFTLHTQPCPISTPPRQLAFGATWAAPLGMHSFGCNRTVLPSRHHYS